ncbi:toxic anion resistance protein [Desulfococcaceae bacterium HSG8]|nr:toxic anion resistance protein [Desulfococcaceae bacterium HSG8]
MQENNAVVVQKNEAMVPDVVSAIKDMTPPKGIPPAEIDKAENAATAIADNILSDPESRSRVMEATRLGEDIQTRSNETFKLMRTSLGQVMDRMAKGDNKSIPNDLIKLREVMDDINPYSAIEQLKRSQTAGWFSRVLGRAPGIGKILRKIAMKYESVQTQVDSIIHSLEAGADKLLENSLEIEERYKILKQLQSQLKVRGYQLQIILSKLEEAKPRITEQIGQMAIQKAGARLLRRLQNLKVTENAFSQFFITMNTTMDNHENLRDAVMSMTTLTRPVLENGLALKIAQQEERQIAEALSSSQEYLGKLMINVAEDAMDNAALTAEVVNSPLIRLQDLTKSYQILMTRMDEASQIEARMMESAKENIKQLEQMTSDLEERAEAQETAREAVRNV